MTGLKLERFKKKSKRHFYEDFNLYRLKLWHLLLPVCTNYRAGFRKFANETYDAQFESEFTSKCHWSVWRLEWFKQRYQNMISNDVFLLFFIIVNSPFFTKNTWMETTLFKSELRLITGVYDKTFSYELI